MKQWPEWGALAAGLAVLVGYASSAPAALSRDRIQAAKATAAWSGRYRYALSLGSNVAGTAMVVSYALVITAKSCRFVAEGYQTDETILCMVKPTAKGIDVVFRSYGDGKGADKYGNAVYSVGDPLFALERRGGKLLTWWKGYPLPDEKPHPVGVYFRREG